MKMFLGGCSGIENPVDMHGVEIKPGDHLSWDFGDYGREPKAWMKKAIFKVIEHKSGKGLCAVGIDKPIYLHDFRFQYCERI